MMAYFSLSLYPPEGLILSTRRVARVEAKFVVMVLVNRLASSQDALQDLTSCISRSRLKANYVVSG